jgi:hypothetical protein
MTTQKPTSGDLHVLTTRTGSPPLRGSRWASTILSWCSEMERPAVLTSVSVGRLPLRHGLPARLAI